MRSHFVTSKADNAHFVGDAVRHGKARCGTPDSCRFKDFVCGVTALKIGA
ncbi:MAG: hypothetical protein KKF30_06215 [Proteobacteria bacterium]|nr:hypothetical protein [Pseudomonadota bacterium]MCG2753434.1 hypothetical protein [Desulfobacteraceae bacterium]